MNLKSLRLFHLIVIHGSLNAASQRLHLSQSAASRLLSQLESETRLKLFSRVNRRLTLTKDGELFYQEAKHILNSIEEIPRIVKDISTQTQERFHLVTTGPIGSCLIAPTITLMRQAYPDFACNINIEGHFEIANTVVTRRHNLGLISLPIINTTSALTIEPIVKVRMEVILPKFHHLSHQETIHVTQLEHEPIISLQPHQQWRRRLDDVFLTAGLTPKVCIETTSSLMVQELVKDGHGISLLDRCSVKLDSHEQLVCRPLMPERWITYACIYPETGRPPLTGLFIEKFHQYIQSLCHQQPEAAHSFILLGQTISD